MFAVRIEDDDDITLSGPFTSADKAREWTNNHSETQAARIGGYVQVDEEVGLGCFSVYHPDGSLSGSYIIQALDSPE